MIPRPKVWTVKLRRKTGATYAVRWQDPTDGTLRCESCGRDKALAKRLAAIRREELSRGLVNDPIREPWPDAVKTLVKNARQLYSAKYGDDVSRALALFAMICRPERITDVDYLMGKRYVSSRSEAVLRCRTRSCRWPNTLIACTCWKCGAELPPVTSVEWVSGETINKDLRTLHAVFEEAVKLYRLPKNPMDGIAGVETQEKQIRVLSLDEQRRLLDACPDKRWRTLLYLALTTGMRRRELTGLTFEQIDLDVRIIMLGRVQSTPGKTKNRKAPVVPLTSEAVAMLKEIRLTHAGPVVFLGDRGSGFDRQIERGIADLISATGIPPFTMHDLRRTFCTSLAVAGVNQKIVQAAARHANAATTAKFYQRAEVAVVAEAIERLPIVRAGIAG